MKIIQRIGLAVAGLMATMTMQAQETYQELEQLTVNEEVTTVITASEPIRFVDISTDKVVGDQPINNTIRLKPKEGGHADGDVLAIVTLRANWSCHSITTDSHSHVKWTNWLNTYHSRITLMLNAYGKIQQTNQ